MNNNIADAGSASQRPTVAQGVVVGQSFYDTDHNKPVWWDGGQWRDANGIVT